MSDLVKNYALLIGSQLATVEDRLACCMGMVMQAATHGQPGVLESAIREAADLKSQVMQMQNLLVEMQAEMQR